MTSLATPLAPIPAGQRRSSGKAGGAAAPRRSSLSSKNKNKQGQAARNSSPKKRGLKKSLTSTGELSKMAHVISVWRDLSLRTKNNDRRLKRSHSLNNVKPKVVFKPSVDPIQSDDPDAIIHDVFVEVLEYDPKEATLTLVDDNWETQSHDDVPWYEQEYEEMAWWEYPDLEEDDELTAIVKDVINESVGSSNQFSEKWIQGHVDRVEALVVSFVLKLKYRVEYTEWLREQQQLEGVDTLEDVSLGSSQHSSDMESLSLANGRRSSRRSSGHSLLSIDESQASTNASASLDGPLFLPEPQSPASSLSKQPIKQDQQEIMRKLLNPSPPPGGNKAITKEDVAAMVVPRRTRAKPRRTRSGTSQQSHSVLDDDSISLHSAVMSTGWNKLNVHNSEMRRYKKNHKKFHRLGTTSGVGARGLWADDHTVTNGIIGNGHGSSVASSSMDGEKSVASFQSSPAMMEYTKTRQAWMQFNPNRHRKREPKKMFKLTTSGTSSWLDQTSVSTSETETQNMYKSDSNLNFDLTGGKKKKKKKKKKAVGLLDMFMTKEELKGSEDQGNIFDIVEEEPEPVVKPKKAANKKAALPFGKTKKKQDEEDDDNSSKGGSSSKGSDDDSKGSTSSGSSSGKGGKHDKKKTAKSATANGVKKTSSATDSNDAMAQWEKALLEVKKEKTTPKRRGSVGNLAAKFENNSGTPFAMPGVAKTKPKKPSLEPAQPAPAPAPRPKPVNPKPSFAVPFKKKAARRASGSGATLAMSMQLPGSQLRGKALTSKKKPKDDDDSSGSPKKAAPVKKKFLTRRASFSDIQVNVSDLQGESSQQQTTSMNDDDPKMRLVMLRHAAMCKQTQKGAVCPSDPKCSQMKELLRHMMGCKHQSQTVPCSFKGCHESKNFLIMMHKTSQVLARQKEMQKDLPPMVCIPTQPAAHGKKVEAVDDDDLSDIGSFGSAGGGMDEEDNEEMAKAKKSLDRSAPAQMAGAGARRSVSPKPVSARTGPVASRRTTWAGKPAAGGAGGKQSPIRSRALLAKMKKDEEEKDRAQSALRERHEAVKARVQRKLQAPRQAPRKDIDSKFVSEAEKRTKDQAAIMESRRIERSAAKSDAPALVEKKTAPVVVEKKIAPVRRKSIGAPRTNFQRDLANKSDEARRAQEQEELRRKHAELKAKMDQSKVEKAEEEATKVLEKIKPVRRKSLPANPGRLTGFGDKVNPSNNSRGPPKSTSTRAAVPTKSLFEQTDEATGRRKLASEVVYGKQIEATSEVARLKAQKLAKKAAKKTKRSSVL